MQNWLLLFWSHCNSKAISSEIQYYTGVNDSKGIIYHNSTRTPMWFSIEYMHWSVTSMSYLVWGKKNPRILVSLDAMLEIPHKSNTHQNRRKWNQNKYIIFNWTESDQSFNLDNKKQLFQLEGIIHYLELHAEIFQKAR